MATNHLANLWMAASDRQTVTDAADRLEVALRNNPLANTTTLGRFYVRTDDPIAVLFELLPDDCMVRVLSVRRTK
jgi:hypothetical protein